MNPFVKVAAKLDTFERDCAVTVALKISDNSCKMDEEQRAVFMSLYDVLPIYESSIFDKSVHDLIREARRIPAPDLNNRIKKQREMAMDIITQNRMKAFKSSVRISLLIAQNTL
ncbi:MAG: hypothetical protein Q8M39_02830 [Sulfuricurvum sp.]|nr:hypothetical protein [Sulfuricurvum sp.]